MPCRSRNGDDRPYPIGMRHRPVERLHAAHRAADDGRQYADAEMIEQPRLGIDHVANGDHRKRHAEALARRRIDAGRAGRAAAPTQHIATDDEMPVGVDRQAPPDQPRPPAGLAGARIMAGDILVHRQRMTNEDGVAALGVEHAIRLIADVQPGQCQAIGKRKRPRQHRVPVKAEAAIQAGGGRGDHPPSVTVPGAACHAYQILTRSLGARYSFSPGLTAKALYHSSMLRTVLVRSASGECGSDVNCASFAASRRLPRQAWA